MLSENNKGAKDRSLLKPMSRIHISRFALLRLAGIAAVLISSAGCPSSSDEARSPGAAPLAVRGEPSVQPGVQPPVDPPPKVEPALLPHEPAAQPLEPGSQPADNPGTLPNPLRSEDVPAAADPPPAAPEALADKHDGEPFDPIKEHGEIFVGWPARVKLALVITGREEGYLEPCGCAGLERMKGGMSRRHSLFKELANKGWPVVGIDVGGQAKGYGRQAEIKFHTVVDGMRKMGYQAIALGATDLRLQTGELASDAAMPSPFISANAALFGFAAEMTAKTQIVEKAGMKLGITAVLGKQLQKTINNPDIEMADPETALEKVVPDLRKQADYLILLAHASIKESVELARKFPDFDLVVTAGGAPEPPAEPVAIQGTKALLIEVGEKGMHAIVLGMFDDARQPLRYQRVPLDSRFPASPDMKLLMTVYQDQLKDSFQELGFPIGTQAPAHPQREVNGGFVGSKACESCHEESYRIWRKSGHAKAYQTLLDLDPPRTFDPECISCHVTGWHPGKYFPYRSGYQSLKGAPGADGHPRLKATPGLINVGCESCHGPGGAHAAAELGSDLALQEKLQAAVRVTKAESEKKACVECHDGDNSPDFDFPTYWPQVEHYEDD